MNVWEWHEERERIFSEHTLAALRARHSATRTRDETPENATQDVSGASCDPPSVSQGADS